MAPTDKKTAVKCKIQKWYKADDSAVHFRRRRVVKQNPTKLRKSIKAGSVLILLAGEFKGKRVVCLKQLPSGLLLVTGPFKINGVPLRRVNQAYVIPTSTKVDVSKVDTSKLNDAFFTRTAAKRVRGERGFFQDKAQTEEQKKANETRLTERKTLQSAVDKTLLASIKGTEFLSKYLSSRFSLSNNSRPHDLVF